MISLRATSDIVSWASKLLLVKEMLSLIHTLHNFSQGLLNQFGEVTSLKKLAKAALLRDAHLCSIWCLLIIFWNLLHKGSASANLTTFLHVTLCALNSLECVEKENNNLAWLLPKNATLDVCPRITDLILASMLWVNRLPSSIN